MARQTKIEWTDATWSPLTGCSVISPGCTNCYAMKLAGGRMKNHPSRAGLTVATKAGPVWTGEVRVNEAWIDQPLRWTKPSMIFACAHSDLFHEAVPDSVIDRVFAVMALAQRHTFQVLTKRAARMRAYLTDPTTPLRIARAMHAQDPTLGGDYPKSGWAVEAAGLAVRLPLPNVWLMVSAEDQARANERIPELLATPAAVRGVSLEPLLGPVDLTSIRRFAEVPKEYLDALRGTCWTDQAGLQNPDPSWDKPGRAFSDGSGGLDWVIVGGENGPRPMRAAWVRPIRDACAVTGVPFLFKQWGTHLPEGQFDVQGFQWAPGDDPRVVWWEERPAYGDPVPDDACAVRIGKVQAGRLLDGVTHDGMPGQ